MRDSQFGDKYISNSCATKKIKQILEETHDSPSGGHFGVNKT